MSDEPIPYPLLELNNPFKLASAIKSFIDFNPTYFEKIKNNESILDESIINDDNKESKNDDIKITSTMNENDSLNIDYKKQKHKYKRNKVRKILRSGNDEVNTLERVIPTQINKAKKLKKKMKPKKVLKKIALALFKGKWTGVMLYENENFNIDTFQSILQCSNIDVNDITSRFVWSIIKCSQKKINDDKINENSIHIKWFWFDDKEWKFRKYNIIVCQWITKQYNNFLKTNKKFIKLNTYNIQSKISFNDMIKDYNDNNNDSKIKINDIFSEFGSNDLIQELIIKKDKNIKKIMVYHSIKLSNNKDAVFFREIRNETNITKLKAPLIKFDYLNKPSPFVAPVILLDA